MVAAQPPICKVPMARLPALTYDLHAARQALRSRFAKNLGDALPHLGPSEATPRLDDREVLALLADLTVHRTRRGASVRETYRSICEDLPAAPRFDDLLDSGLVRQAGDDTRVDADAHVLWNANGDVAAALRALRDALQGVRYEVGHPERHTGAMAAIVTLMTTQPQDVRTLQCQSPDWVAARLWETLGSEVEVSHRFTRWVEGWELLGFPELIPSRAWTDVEAATFKDAVLAWLQGPNVLLNWDGLALRREMHSRMVRGEADVLTAPVPAPVASSMTLIDRAGLVDDAMAPHRPDHMLLLQGVPGIARLLLAEIEAAQHAVGPHPTAIALFTLALDRPELLLAIKWRTMEHPILYADLCLFPPMAPLASVWIEHGQWRGGGRRLNDAHLDETTRVAAFGDALATCAHFLKTGQLAATEFAPVVKLIRERHVAAGVSQQEVAATLLSAVRRVLLDQDTGTLSAMAAALINVAEAKPDDHAALGGALDVIATGLLEDTIEPSPVIDAYVKIINDERRYALARYIDTRAAGALLALATRSSRRLRDSFLFAVDMPLLRNEAAKDADRHYQMINEACHRLRAHVAVLCRGVVGTPEIPSNEIVDALIENIDEGFFVDEQYGEADAFSDRHASPGFGRAEPSIARDFALALDRLNLSDRDRLLTSIVKSSEPVMLAELQQMAPASTKETLGKRLSSLAEPGAAARAWSLHVLQMRIEELINAGNLDAAQRFLDDETNAKTNGKVPGREQMRLRLTLRILYARGEFDAILAFAGPAGGSPDDSAARDVIDFYKALACIGHGRDRLEFAIGAFERLHKGHPGVSAYGVNFIAARIQWVMPENVFGQVAAEHREEARRVLADAAAMAEMMAGWPSSDRDLLDLNRAILLLASGGGAAALALLSPLVSSSLQANAMAFFAVALARTGRGDDATRALDSAAKDLGNTPLIAAAKAQVQYGTAHDGGALVTTADALAGPILLLHFLAQPPHRQAVLLYGSAEEAQAKLIREVRLSAATVAELAVVLRQGKCHPSEDDVTKLFGALLEARKRFVGWSWQEQSPGGLTHDGREGRRDLALLEDGVAHAVLEAVVCDRPLETKWASGELVSHYLKLFAYAPSRLFFHVVYSYTDDPYAVLTHLKGVAEKEVPSGFAFLVCADHEVESSLPPGFTARYRRQDGDIVVAFVVVDMRKLTQLGAAAMAVKANPRAGGRSKH